MRHGVIVLIRAVMHARRRNMRKEGFWCKLGRKCDWRLERILDRVRQLTQSLHSCENYSRAAPKRICNGVSCGNRILCPRATTWLNTDQAAPYSPIPVAASEENWAAILPTSRSPDA